MKRGEAAKAPLSSGWKGVVGEIPSGVPRPASTPFPLGSHENEAPERAYSPRIFTRCDILGHPSRAVLSYRWPGVDYAEIVVCTYRRKSTKQPCGREYGVFES